MGICDKQVKPAVSEFEARPEAYPTTNSPSSFHVGEGDCAALQTIRLSAVITGEGRVSHRGLEFYLMLAAIVTLSQLELFSLHGLIPETRQD